MQFLTSSLSSRLSEVLVVSFGLGLVLPKLPGEKDLLVSFLMGILIWLACSKIAPDPLKSVDSTTIIRFYLLRFVLLPAGLLLVTGCLSVESGLTFFLLAAMPAGVSSAALTAICGGEVALALLLTVATSFLTPLSVPGLLWFGSSGPQVLISLTDLAQTLTLLLFIPFILDRGFERFFPRKRQAIAGVASGVSVLLLGVLLAIIVNAQQEAFFEVGLDHFISLFFLFLLFAFFYLLGWWAFRSNGRAQQIAGAIASGANNNALAISLGFVYFPEHVAVLVLSEISWVLGISTFKRFIAKKDQQHLIR